jgi:hypothetical protein
MSFSLGRRRSLRDFGLRLDLGCASVGLIARIGGSAVVSLALALATVAPAQADDVETPKATGAHDDGDSFVAIDGKRWSFSEAYDQGNRPLRRETNYRRAFVEGVVFLGIGLGFYELSRESNKVDWDYPNVQARFRDLEVAFDTNKFAINFMRHPIAGGVFYTFSRTNGLSIPMGFVYATVSEMLWEFAFEVREKPSINDMMTTSTMGFPMGEYFVHLGDYVNSAAHPRWYHDLLGIVLGPSHRLHRAMDGTTIDPARAMPADRLGFSSFWSHRFDILLGGYAVKNDVGDSKGMFNLRLAGELVSIPGFLRPGRFSLSFSDGELVEAIANVGLGSHTDQSWDFLFDANLFGHYSQDIDPAGGHAFMFAFNSSARYTDRPFLGRRESYALAHLAGPSIKWWGIAGDFMARLEAAAHVDFGGIRSHAYKEWTAANGDGDVASVLRQEGYFYGLGASALARARLSWKSLELGSRLFVGRYGSVDRWDRFQHDAVTQHEVDTLAEIEAWFAIVPPETPLELRVFVEHLPHRSEMGPFTTTRWDRRYGLAVGSAF